MENFEWVSSAGPCFMVIFGLLFLLWGWLIPHIFFKANEPQRQIPNQRTERARATQAQQSYRLPTPDTTVWREPQDYYFKGQ